MSVRGVHGSQHGRVREVSGTQEAGDGVRILVTGSRRWTDREVITQALYDVWQEAGFPRDVTVVHGACPYGGADAIAAEVAKQHFGWVVDPHPADWKMLKKAAGPIRNQEMVDLGADVCLAFIMPDSRGTLDCAERAERAHIPVRRFFSAGVVPGTTSGSLGV